MEEKNIILKIESKTNSAPAEFVALFLFTTKHFFCDLSRGD